MAINVSQSFHRTSANPIDETIALTKAQMLTVNDNLMPAYYFTICQDDGYIYLYDKTATASVTTGKFKKFEGGSGGSIQVTTLPTAGVGELGNIYQYVGVNTASYTNGYFYKCVNNSGTYTWENIKVQAGGGTGGSGLIVDGTLLASGWDANNQQTLTFTDYDSDMGGVIGVPCLATDAQKEAYASAIINVVAQTGNQFTFEAETVPAIDLPVTLYAGGSGGGASLPSGGTTGQALVKKSSADDDVEWGDVSGEQIQYSTMPTASAANLGQIVQYIGTTTVVAPIYKNGLFYECVSDGAVSPTYSWEQKDVQSYPEVDLTNVFASGMPVASIVGPERYSTNEIVVGTWINNKPIYRKVIECGTVTGSTEKLVPYNVSNVEEIVKTDLMAASATGYINLNYTDTGSVIFAAIVYVNDSTYGSVIRLMPRTSHFNGYGVRCVLEYTKTTD